MNPSRNRVAAWVQRTQLRRKVAQFDRLSRLGERGLAERFGQQQAEVMHREMVEEFRRLAPHAPRIGRDGSPAAGNLPGAYSALAVYRVVQRHGGTVVDAGRLLHDVYRARLERTPKVLRTVMAWYLFSGLRRRQWTRGARRSQARRYPAEWVLVMIPAEGKDFDVGYDITQCGIVTYLHVP